MMKHRHVVRYALHTIETDIFIHFFSDISMLGSRVADYIFKQSSARVVVSKPRHEFEYLVMHKYDLVISLIS